MTKITADNYFKKNIIQATALTAAAAMLITTAAVTNPVQRYAKTDDIVVAANGTAGIVTAINIDQSKAMTTAYATEQTTEVTEVAATVGDDEWADKLMAKVDDYLCVRAEASEDASIVGKMYKGDVGTVVDQADGFYHITSGNVDGYVSEEYAAVGDDAKALAEEVCTEYAYTTVAGLRVRSAASEDASIVTAIPEDGKAEVDKEADAVDGWVAVKYDGKSGYVKADYVNLDLDLGDAITIEEEKAAQAKAAQSKTATTIQNAAIAASYDDETLLAALIQCEAGGYDAELAVGAVVMNRVRSGGYPSSISGVIYQSGQFGPARTGAVARVAASGPSSTARAAAQAALSGTDPTGGCTHFQPAHSGHAGVVIGGNVFF